MHYTSKEVYQSISQQTNDPIVEWKTCRISWAEFPIYKSDLDFYDKISPVFNGVRYQIPTPTLCPEERQRRRLIFRNDRKLYRGRCDLTNKPIITIYKPESGYKVYSQEARWGDNWNALNYGQDYDFSKTFTDQFANLYRSVPKISNLVMLSENCEYNVIMGNSKNCYMCSTTFQSEACSYCYRCVESNYCVDCVNVLRCEGCYETVDSTSCNNVQFGELCNTCSHSKYLFDCQGCAFCIGCTGLRNKQYHIFNKAYSKEEYQRLSSQLSEDTIITRFNELKKTVIREGMTQVNCTQSFGNNLTDCKNCSFDFNIADATNSKYSYDSNVLIKDSMDVSMIGDKVNFMYECVASGYEGYHSAFSNLCWTNDSLYYCDHCMYCKHCFGCVWLRNQEYCILNKQYTKEEYEKLVPQIIEKMKIDKEWWEFFDPSISSFAYNETAAHMFLPLSQEEAIEKGYIRLDKEYPVNIPNGIETIAAYDLPLSSDPTSEEILGKAILCEKTWKPFRIIKQELEFYRKHNLPLPRKHPDVRHEERIRIRPKRELHLRKCDHCNVQMLSVYDKVYQWKVYCESCYQKEIYG